ncbi:MAG: Hpt domain-containing protein [Lachnospiraceae bacterium]
MLSTLLPDVNVSIGITYCGGKIENYLEVLQIMYDEAESQLNLLNKHYESEDWNDFTILAHALKGSCLNVGAEKCGNAAKALETAGKAQDISYIRTNLQSFEDEYRKLLQTFRNVFQKYNIPTAASSGSDSSGQVAEILKDFKKSVSEYDFASATALLKKAHTASDADEHTELLNQLDALMDDMNIEQIMSLIP